MDRIILDLCGGTGSWSLPYKNAGYDVRLVTLPHGDVRFYNPPGEVHGVLMAPPCTLFSYAGNRWKRTSEEIAQALEVVWHCYRIASECNPMWWVLENPRGKLVNYIGEPIHKFDPCDYGDPYTKKTYLWGNFTIPQKNHVYPCYGSMMHTLVSDPVLRSMTPSGFSRAFFLANP